MPGDGKLSLANHLKFEIWLIFDLSSDESHQGQPAGSKASIVRIPYRDSHGSCPHKES